MLIRPTQPVSPARRPEVSGRIAGRDAPTPPATPTTDRVAVSSAARGPSRISAQQHVGQDVRVPLAAAVRSIHDRVLGRA